MERAFSTSQPSPFSPQQKTIPSGFVCARPREPAVCARERRLCRRLVRSHYDPGAESRGKLLFLQFWDGLLGGTSRPGCQSVCASPPLLLLLLPGAPRGAPWQYQVLCSAGSLRWEISCAPLGPGDEFYFFFLPRSHRCLVCSPPTKRVCKRDPAEHAERPFAHPSHRIRPIISTYSKLWFFFNIINII